MNTETNTDANKPAQPQHRRREGARYETCCDCGLDWNVSKHKEIPPGERYCCPRCWSKYRNK